MPQDKEPTDNKRRGGMNEALGCGVIALLGVVMVFGILMAMMGQEALVTSNAEPWWSMLSLFVIAPAVGILAILLFFATKVHPRQRRRDKDRPQSEGRG